jgi:alpha-tubulin suppressor-like RCC1 family protein
MPNQFFSPEGDLENYYVTDYWLIDQYIGDRVWTWGTGAYGRLGNATITNSSTPSTTFAGGTNWKQVVAGGVHSVAIKTDGTLWSWGYSTNGRNGNGVITGNRSTPVTTFAGGTNWRQVGAGGAHVAAIKTDGTLWVWGSSSFTQLGNNAIGDRSTPITTFAGGTNWKQVSCAAAHTAAIKTDGTLWTWGRGSSGQLGNATINDRPTPVTTFAGGTNWKQVCCGESQIAAIKTDGTLWTWGSGNQGALGNANTTTASTPVTTFAGGTNWKQVSALGSVASNYMSAIKTDGTLWIWGGGANGRLGNANTTNVSTPITTFAGGTNWKQVSCGESHTSAIKTDGTLWVWGSGSNGRLGNASTTDRSTPVTTSAGGTNWKQLSGNNHTIVVEAGISAEYPLS